MKQGVLLKVEPKFQTGLACHSTQLKKQTKTTLASEEDLKFQLRRGKVKYNCALIFSRICEPAHKKLRSLLVICWENLSGKVRKVTAHFPTRSHLCSWIYMHCWLNVYSPLFWASVWYSRYRAASSRISRLMMPSQVRAACLLWFSREVAYGIIVRPRPATK